MGCKVDACSSLSERINYTKLIRNKIRHFKTETPPCVRSSRTPTLYENVIIGRAERERRPPHRCFRLALCFHSVWPGPYRTNTIQLTGLAPGTELNQLNASIPHCSRWAGWNRFTRAYNQKKNDGAQKNTAAHTHTHAYKNMHD